MDDEDAAVLPVPEDHEGHFVDETFSDATSAYSASLTPSITNYPEEHGRRYHAFRRGRYLLPNDDKEMQRLDLVDEMIKLTLGGLHLAPIGPNPQRVLDIGTGSGAWAIRFADEYPSAEVIGNDLSPTQPADIPPNVKFLVDDVEEEWEYGSRPFDFIHSRYMVFAIRDMKHLIQQAFNALRPGGWLEVQDFDSRINSPDNTIRGTCLEYWNKSTVDAFESMGFWTRIGPEYSDLLNDAGFVNIQMKKFPIPLGKWAKDENYKRLGELNVKQLTEVLEAASMAVLTRSGWAEQEIYAMCAGARNDARNRRIHAKLDFYVFTAQRPPPSGATENT
ncbi:hypothetical protein D8B26_005180 [Coccidioides posadasii str. Silveira]|uniref:Uncharacterized protein n=1 Tax=Coccidioides posadasii (strain RMSCC 757 / Silveira) TaxID=443226 RepID=E9D643_COCPS|nr:conserved hypothetical protein [Coccidioides posadasii str. Silveira]QVM10522.1 hypothetical protein D8B26_005180 [Coccidioides posadasii str. Silveira]